MAYSIIVDYVEVARVPGAPPLVGDVLSLDGDVLLVRERCHTIGEEIAGERVVSYVVRCDKVVST